MKYSTVVFWNARYLQFLLNVVEWGGKRTTFFNMNRIRSNSPPWVNRLSLIEFYTCWKIVFFWPHTYTALRKNWWYILFQIATSAYLKTAIYLFSDVLGVHELIGTKIWFEGDCVGFSDQGFYDEKKSRSTMQKAVWKLVDDKSIKNRFI